MKVKFLLAASCFAATVCCSCSQEQELSEQTGHAATNALSISPEVMNETASRAGFTSKTAWQTNDAMGLFIWKSSGWGDKYPRFDKPNNKSTKTAKGWHQDNPVYLLHDKASIWAYYPYSTSATDGTKIPVSITTGTGQAPDYMWGKSSNQVSVIDTDAKIPMKHALAQFVLRLKVSPDYKNDGKLTAAKIKSKSAKFATSGTMNLNDEGKIAFSPSLTELVWTPNTTIPANGSSPVDFNAAVFPMNIGQGEVTLEVDIDGATYKYDMPAITWKAGYRHIYAIKMESNDVVIGGENGLGITIEPWKDASTDIVLTPVK